MKLVLALAVVIVSASPVLAQTAFCPYGQTCNGKPSVPFPVISPVQGLSNLLPQRQQPPPSPPVAYAPIPTPPPVMPATSP